MNVFISWSGPTSKAIAQVLKDWLPSVIQQVQPYFSPVDIDKGTRWNSEINRELEATDIGLLVLTQDNITAPWVLFEAGSLAKKLDKSRVCPILFGLEPTDIQPPLAMFQATRFKKDDMFQLMVTLNDALNEKSLTRQVLDNVFTKWWPDLEAHVVAILKKTAPTALHQLRNDRELLEEVLLNVRALRQDSTGKSLPLSTGQSRLDVASIWEEYLSKVIHERISLGTTLRACKPLSLTNTTLTILCPSEYHQTSLRRNRRLLEQILHDNFDLDVAIDSILDQSPAIKD